MPNTKKYLDSAGITKLWEKLSLQDYPNNETLIAALSAIDETKANRDEVPTIDEIYEEIVSRLSSAEDQSF